MTSIILGKDLELWGIMDKLPPSVSVGMEVCWAPLKPPRLLIRVTNRQSRYEMAENHSETKTKTVLFGVEFILVMEGDGIVKHKVDGYDAS